MLSSYFVLEKAKPFLPSSGVTTTYTPQGQSIGSSQIDNGQTNYYSPAGAYQGTNTATPAPMQPNTTINTPRQAPQAPVMRGW
jgi:hypothetical protein